MRARNLPFYYGWIVLAASAVAELLAQGATSYASGLFVLPLQAEFHISRAQANSAVLILFAGSALLSPLAGRLLDRLPIRWAVSLGALLFCGTLALIAVSNSLAVMALLLALPGALGFMLIGPLNTSTLAARWFWRHRGLALGFAAVATSAGGLVVVPLLSQVIAAHGWRGGLLHEAAALALVIIALSLLLLRDRPADLGLESHGENLGRSETAGARPGWRAILSRRDFWMPALTLASISSLCQAVVVTLVPYGVQLGLALSSAAFLISAFAICAAVAKVVAGFLADRLDQRRMVLGAMLVMALCQLLFLAVPDRAGLLAGACLAGISLGCALPTASGLVARAFGSNAFGAVMGWVYALTLVLSIVASLFIGMVFDRTHGYGAAFASFLALSLAVLAVAALLSRRTA